MKRAIFLVVLLTLSAQAFSQAQSVFTEDYYNHYKRYRGNAAYTDTVNKTSAFVVGVVVGNLRANQVITIRNGADTVAVLTQGASASSGPYFVPLDVICSTNLTFCTAAISDATIVWRTWK